MRLNRPGTGSRAVPEEGINTGFGLRLEREALFATLVGQQLRRTGLGGVWRLLGRVCPSGCSMLEGKQNGCSSRRCRFVQNIRFTASTVTSTNSSDSGPVTRAKSLLR